MGASSGYEETTQARVRMVAQPASVPLARKFVDDALTGWGWEALSDDVGLCVTELSTNATLHSGSDFFEIELQQVAASLLVAVLDTGRVPADAIVAKSEFSDAFLDDVTADDALTNGRGMFIVSALSSSWGIDELPDGKRVWALFTQEGEPYDAQEPEITRWGGLLPHEELNPDDWFVVRFRDCPAALLLAHDDNLTEMFRELQLIGLDPERQSSRELAELMAGHVQKHAVNWDAARLMAHDAVRAGREFADIDVLAPKDVVEDMRLMRRLINEAEAMSVAGALMTLPAAPEVQGVRDWLETEFCAQAVQEREPVSYPTWLADRGNPGRAQ